MISFKGFEIVPATGMFSTGVKQIRITVSAKKVGLSEQLLDALKHPAYKSVSMCHYEWTSTASSGIIGPLAIIGTGGSTYERE